MFAFLFSKQAKLVNEIKQLIDLHLSSDEITPLLPSIEVHASAILETLTLLKEKGRSEKIKTEEDNYYGMPNPSLLSRETIFLTLNNASLLEDHILTEFRRKSSFSQDDFQQAIDKAIEVSHTSLYEETDSLLDKKTN